MRGAACGRCPFSVWHGTSRVLKMRLLGLSTRLFRGYLATDCFWVSPKELLLWIMESCKKQSGCVRLQSVFALDGEPILPKHDKAKKGRHAAPAAGAKAQGGKPVSSSGQAQRKVGVSAAEPSVTLAMPAQSSYVPSQSAMIASGATGGSMPGMPPKKRSGAKIAAIVLGVLLALLLAVYSAVAVYFSMYFMPNTALGPLNVSLMSVEQAEDAVSGLVAGYVLEVEGGDFSVSYTSEQLGMKADHVEVVQAAHAQINHWLWPLELTKDHDVSSALVASHDAETMWQEVAAQVEAFNAEATQPVSATLAYDAEADRFEIAPEQLGTALDAEAVVAAMDESIVALEQKLQLDDGQLLQPAVKADDERLIAAQQQANTMIATDFDITANGEVILDGGPDIASQWIVIDENVQVAFDEAAMQAWSDELAVGFNTVGTTRTYTRPDGKECSVTGGTYGWSADTSGLLDQVKEALSSGQPASIELPCSKTAEQYLGPGKQDWGSRYIDIDLSEQYVRLFDGDEILWESDCVSGKPNGSDTPTGVYVINGKQSPSKLIGYENGKKIYESVVSYWMPFVGNMVGLHDANWQPGFGGTMYRDGYGSHGCVNLPVSKAGELYDLISAGDVVVCHW